MDRPPHDYPYSQQQQQQQQQPRPSVNMQQQQQQFGFHPQHQQFQPAPPPFLPPHPSMQQFSYPHHLAQQQPPASQLHPLISHPQMLLQQQPPPHSFQHILPPAFHGPYDTPPPKDPELQKRIDKLVEYSVKNGPEFEAMIRTKQQDNPEYSFLFGGEGHGYYRYKLWLSSRPPSGAFNPSFPASSVPMMHPPNPAIAPSINASGSIGNTSQMHQSHFQPFYDSHHHPSPAFGAHGRPPFDQSSHLLKTPPLPPEVALELNNVIGSLNGTKESIKGAKIWFMQRAHFAAAIAEALKEIVLTLDDSKRQLHIIYLANDILFESLPRRVHVTELDNEAIAFKSVMGAMLARVYHNPQNKDENQSRLQKIIQFWAAKEVYDQETIRGIEAEMVGGASLNSYQGPAKDLSAPVESMTTQGQPQPIGQSPLQWQPDRQSMSDSEHPDKRALATMAGSLGSQPFIPNPAAAVAFAGSVPLASSVAPSTQQLPFPPTLAEKCSPYPLFPPGLIPGMVRKMQIGSGVPYSPLSPLDIPTMIPPSEVPPTEILERVSKFFKEIGEKNPSEGPMASHSTDDYDDYEREPSNRKSGACIPPPPNLQVDPETGTYPDGSVERRPNSNGSGRLGLGASADPNEPSQYDDVYSSYRKQRSTNYHSSMSARAAAR